MHTLIGLTLLLLSFTAGTSYVNVREYYEQDGVLKPGKKGISLSVEQWAAVVAAAGAVDAALAAHAAQ
jgi:hypothetical protein